MKMQEGADFLSATWVGWYAVHTLYPEFEVWPQFVTEAVQTAQHLDALRASHPVEVNVRRAEEVEQIFDDISVSQLAAPPSTICDDSHTYRCRSISRVAA